MKKNYSEQEVRTAVSVSKSIAGVLRKLELRPVGGNYKTIHHLIEKYHIDTSHFTGQGWNVGLQFKPKTRISDEDIFVIDSDYRCSWRLRERYKKITGISYCEQCNLSEWQNNPIPLEIHHLNGNNTDNRHSPYVTKNDRGLTPFASCSFEYPIKSTATNPKITIGFVSKQASFHRKFITE